MKTETASLTASSPQVCATTASKFALSDGGITMVGQAPSWNRARSVTGSRLVSADSARQLGALEDLVVLHILREYSELGKPGSHRPRLPVDYTSKNELPHPGVLSVLI